MLLRGVLTLEQREKVRRALVFGSSANLRKDCGSSYWRSCQDAALAALLHSPLSHFGPRQDLDRSAFFMSLGMIQEMLAAL